MASDISERLRAAVADRAEHRCEYCLLHDHIVGRKHGGSSDFDNLAYACVLCNRHKGSDIASIDPQTGEAVRLFHPRRDRWANHFYLETEFIAPRTKVGSATVRLLKLNAAERIAERRLLQLLGRFPQSAV